ncbi:cytochrome c biogenesis CcdA family protein [Neobacillus sp. LXY-4]|uniref:cytochrome c biogenesis CcdA family protein n=1 Tax=Neobacillus sp. LXY-4 TaxID=3379826 RepID=UPI003EE1B758
MNELLEEVLKNSLWFSVIVTFLAGILSSISPCNLSSIPLLLGYLEASEKKENQFLPLKKKFFLSIFYILGTATTFVSMGLLFSLLGEILGPLKEVLTYLAVVITFIMGLVLLELIPFELSLSIDKLISKIKIKGFLGSYVLGFLMGFTTSQCATPVLLVILTYVMLEGKLLFGGVLLLMFALGRGIPLVILGTLSGMITSISKIKKYSQYIQHGMGVLLIIMSFYLFWIA